MSEITWQRTGGRTHRVVVTTQEPASMLDLMSAAAANAEWYRSLGFLATGTGVTATHRPALMTGGLFGSCLGI